MKQYRRTSPVIRRGIAMKVTDHANHQIYQTINGQNRQADRSGKAADSGTGQSSRTAVEDAAPIRAEASSGKTDNAAPGYPTDPKNDRANTPNDLTRKKQRQASSAKQNDAWRAHTTLYSSTADLMAIANTESQETLRGIYVRLSFKLWSVRAAGATGTNSKTVKTATRSIEKVMGKVKRKIKCLQKEEEMEKKAAAARKAKQRRLQQEIRRQLAIKRKIRKNREKKDIEESYWESDGQYAPKGCQDTLPENVLVEMEMQRSAATGAGAAAATMPVDTVIAAAGADTGLGVDTVSAIAEVSGAVVDLAL